MRDSAYRWLLVENLQIFRRYVKHFWIFPREKICKVLICLCKYVFVNRPMIFLELHNKTKLVLVTTTVADLRNLLSIS